MLTTVGGLIGGVTVGVAGTLGVGLANIIPITVATAMSTRVTETPRTIVDVFGLVMCFLSIMSVCMQNGQCDYTNT